jgi:general secretion pathway protein D
MAKAHKSNHGSLTGARAVRRLRSLLCGVILALVAGTPAMAQTPTITPNYKDADIRQIIEAVSEVTGQNFIIDPRVKAQVTMLSSTPMSPDAFYEAFLSILEVRGYVAVPSGDLTKIVPDANARQVPGRDLPRTTAGPGDELLTQVVQVNNVGAAQLVPILRPLIPQYGHLAAHPASNMLIISDRSANVNRMLRIIRRIDQAGDEEIEIIRLEHGSAADIVRVVTSLTQAANRADTAGGALSMVADERTNSILISGDKTTRLKIRTLITHLDTPLEQGGNTQVLYLNYADAESVVAQLDIRRAQVMVEAIVAEVSYNKAAQLGVSWVIDGSEGGNIVGLTKFTSALNVTDIGGALVGDDQQIAQALQAIPDGATIGVGDFSGSTRWAAIIRALLGDASTNVLATPTIMTLDNEEAELSVGQEVPFVTGQFTNTGAAQGSVNPFQTIQREDVGLKLKVTPQINEGDALILEIQLENSNLQASSQGAVDLVTNERTITQKVLVENGQVLVMGGLVDDQIVEIDEKVPFLGDIPFAGNLFKSQSSTVTKRTLMVFIRPVIIRDAKTASNVTNKKYRLMRGVQLGEREEGDVLMMKDLRRPVMPELPEGGLPPEVPTGIMGRDPSIYPTVKPEAETEEATEQAPEEAAPPPEESQ